MKGNLYLKNCRFPFLSMHYLLSTIIIIKKIENKDSRIKRNQIKTMIITGKHKCEINAMGDD